MKARLYTSTQKGTRQWQWRTGGSCLWKTNICRQFTFAQKKKTRRFAHRNNYLAPRGQFLIRVYYSDFRLFGRSQSQTERKEIIFWLDFTYDTNTVPIAKRLGQKHISPSSSAFRSSDLLPTRRVPSSRVCACNTIERK